MTMDTHLNRILWNQLGAAIDMIGNAIGACPDTLWSDSSKRPEWVRNSVVGFWHVAYHALFFLDLQLSGSAEGFAPPPPFDLSELDPDGLLPERPYTKDEVLSYVRHCREKARAVLADLTTEKANRPCQWASMDLTFAELLLYTMRHVQHHAGQLNLLLRQQTESSPRYVKQVQAAAGY